MGQRSYTSRSVRNSREFADSGASRTGPTFRSAFYAAAIFVGVDLIFAAIGVLSAPAAAQIGSTRPTATIPLHEAEIAGVGLMLGLGAAVFYGRKGLPLALLVPALAVLLDLDHIPAYVGMAEPIRPAHSLIFISLVLALTMIVTRRPDVSLVVLSAFSGHLAVDEGVFPALSPLSFVDVSIDPYRVLFLACAVLSAVAAGMVLRRSSNPGTDLQPRRRGTPQYDGSIADDAPVARFGRIESVQSSQNQASDLCGSLGSHESRRPARRPRP